MSVGYLCPSKSAIVPFLKAKSPTYQIVVTQDKLPRTYNSDELVSVSR